MNSPIDEASREEQYVLSKEDLLVLLNKAARMGKKRAPRKIKERSDEQKAMDKERMAQLTELRRAKKANKGGQSYTDPAKATQ